MITRDNNCRRLLLAVPKVHVLSSDSLMSVLDEPGHRQSRSEDIRSQLMPYTGNNNGHGPGTITNIHIPSVASSNLLFPPNADFHTGQQQ